LRILVVDDEPMMTRAVMRMLKPSGHLVSAAASGEEAVEKLTEQTFDVVVSDMGMGSGLACGSCWPRVGGRRWTQSKPGQKALRQFSVSRINSAISLERSQELTTLREWHARNGVGNFG
jgi:CheY-like chemotaxis protein